MTDRRIEAANPLDIETIVRALVHADAVVRGALGFPLEGTPGDLGLIQRLLDSRAVARGATYTLEALGLAIGKIFVNQNPGYDWWILKDEFRREPVIRFQKSSLLAFPRAMLSKRIEDGERVNVPELFKKLELRMNELAEQAWIELQSTEAPRIVHEGWEAP